MRYALLLHSPEPTEDRPIDPDAIRQMMEAMGRYGRALAEAGVLVGADILAPQAKSSTVTLRGGSVQIQDGPFAQTREALAGVFVLDVPDADAALGWAEKHPAATYGVIEIRPVATSCIDGEWTGPA